MRDSSSDTAVGQRLGEAVLFWDGAAGDDDLRSRAALVIGTPESTQGRIPSGQVSLLVFDPLTGATNHRMARYNDDVSAFAGI